MPIHKKLDLEKLKNNLYSLPKKVEAIPNVSSLYEKNWGFCIRHKEKNKLKKEFMKYLQIANISKDI